MKKINFRYKDTLDVTSEVLEGHVTRMIALMKPQPKFLNAGIRRKDKLYEHEATRKDTMQKLVDDTNTRYKVGDICLVASTDQKVEITKVYAQRLQETTKQEMRSIIGDGDLAVVPRFAENEQRFVLNFAYESFIDSLYPNLQWNLNPWFFVYEFKLIN